MNKTSGTVTKQRNIKTSSQKQNLRKRPPRKSAETMPLVSFKQRIIFTAIETLSLITIITFGIIIVLGNEAHWFTGTHFLGNLFPFAAGVLVLILTSSLFLAGWWKLRAFLNNRSLALLPIFAISLVYSLGFLIGIENLNQSIDRFRILVGGKQETQRVTLTHQVFAAYRRYNSNNLVKMIHRAEPYRSAIFEAAKQYDIDPELLEGIAATESSFKPRDSADGGHGLFQITAVPKTVLEESKDRLGTENLLYENPRTNAFIAAATLKHYLGEMNNDLYLALLAYNIGPANGGLRFIMKKYGVTDFITIQPYLQLLPRDYPIRVLSYALAFRIWQKHGQLLAYEEGSNALKIQKIGIPNLE